jgi:hypothetical protein
MDKESIFKKLLENTPLVIIVIGLFLFVLGAAGGLSKADLKIESTPWRIALAAMGAIVSIVGGLFLVRENSGGSSSKELSKDYGIKISHPKNGDEVGNPVKLFGTYKIKPPKDLIRIVEYSPMLNQYWPKEYIKFDNNGDWDTEITIGGSGEKRKIFIVAIGGDTKALLDYSKKVGKETNRWIGIENLTSDFSECAVVEVRLRSDRA